MNILKVVVVILIIVAVAAVVIFLLGQFEATQPLYTQIIDTLTPIKDKATEFLSSPTGMLTSVGGIAGLATIGGLLYSKLSSAKNQLSTVQSQVSSASDAAKKR